MRPHEGQPVRTAGKPVQDATHAMVMMHGRGATPESILDLVPAIGVEEVAFLAPWASGSSWYPNSFLSPVKVNEPGISSSLWVIAQLLKALSEAGIPNENVFLLGFSQGACLSLEFAARNPRRYAGVFGLSGGLIGPEGTVFRYTGSMEGTPVFLGCSDIDFHIPKTRVEESAEVFRELEANVDMRLYPGMPHTVNEEEISVVRETLLDALR